MQAFELLGHAEYSILHGSKGPKHFESQGCYWVMRKSDSGAYGLDFEALP